MTSELYIPFSTAAQDVFRMMLDIETSTSIPEISHKIRSASNTVNILIGITGDLSGEIYYCFPKNTTLQMVKIMSGMDFDEIDEFVTSAMGEVANIISGNALIGLSEKEINCDLQPPKILYGENLPANDSKQPVISTLVKSDIGDVELNIVLKQ